RHTRSKRDWSSDVCSSDLTVYLLFFYFHPFFQIWGGFKGYNASLLHTFKIASRYIRLILISGHFLFFQCFCTCFHLCFEIFHLRSEERRVGKECRSLCST